METHTAITLLTIADTLLTIVILTILVLAIVLLFKVSKLIRNLNHISDNVVAATAWLSPVKVFTQASKIFRKK